MNKVISAKVSKEYYDKVVSLGPISDIVRKAVDNFMLNAGRLHSNGCYDVDKYNEVRRFLTTLDGDDNAD